MKSLIVLILLPVLLTGCSGPGGPAILDVRQNNKDLEQGDIQWNLGYYLLSFSADHTELEMVPRRLADYHFLVTKFLEGGPCDDCLKIGKPEVQPDGTVKLDVTIKHPFPNSPQYTGFDVRGMVYFPVTESYPSDIEYISLLYGENGNPNPMFPEYYAFMPIAFSRVADGGGELLNADGYSCYMVPGETYSLDWPIFSYQPGVQGNDPTPQTTITPYRLFASDNDRRMFLVSDEITREYHFALPPGEFNFGYAVDASWWPPSTMPVTDPATDFPRAANAEDPWWIEYEQLLPIKEENVGKDIFKVTVHHRGTDALWLGGYMPGIYLPLMVMTGQISHIPNLEREHLR